MAPSLIYCAAAANRNSNVADARATDGLVVFGAGQLVALWSSTSTQGVHATLPGHQAQVTTLKFITPSLFLSGDNVGIVRVWVEVGSQWGLHAVLEGHKHSVSAVASIVLPGSGEDIILATGSSDGTIRCWRLSPRPDSTPQLLQIIEMGGKLPLEMAMSYLPASESIVLAIGSTENRIQIFTSSTLADVNFKKSLSLEGHSDWVRSLNFIIPIPLSSPSASTVSYDIAPGELLLASGSQDNYIRLWRFSRLSSLAAPAKTGLGALDELERELAEAEKGGEGELRVKAHDFFVQGDGEFECSAEAVILGHDAWVTGLHWAPLDHSSAKPQVLRLLSASADRSMILWTPSSDTSISKTSIWTPTQRFGEFSSATNLGFFGALFGYQGRSVLANGWGGAFHCWREEEGGWEPILGIGGHFGAVKGVDWEREGEFLLSAGGDMTTRMHAPWRRMGLEGATSETWHELGRPQIHGYPITSVAFTDRLQFISGADEKIVRVFEAPRVVLASLTGLSKLKGLGSMDERPMAANVPPLGLSNRAIASPDELEKGPSSSDHFNSAMLPTDFAVSTHPPFEEQLLGATLWPEIEKIYGHGYEINAVASSHSSSLVATSCKASTAEHAVIRLYSTTTWKQTGAPLAGHQLTITSIQFSPDDRWVLSVSRDRSWRVWERKEGESGYVSAGSAKEHARIIWDCAWAADSSFFVTASRDKTVKMWSGSEWKAAATLKFEEAATAIDCCQISNPPRHLLAVGLENGHVHLFTSPLDSAASWSPLIVLDSSIAHVLTVTSVKFCPKEQDGRVRLASGSEDKSARIIEVEI